MMKKYVLALFVGLLALPIQGWAKQIQTEEPNQLTVISYNIRLGVADDGPNSWEFRKAASPAMILDQKPDIFGLQEAYNFQVDYLLQHCKDYSSVGVPRDDGKEKGEIMAIFYNKKVIELERWGTFWLSSTPSVPSKGWDAACRRTATWAFMKDKRTGKYFFYVNTHLDHIGVEARIKGLQLVVDTIAQMNKENLPVVLTGDFNVKPADSCLDHLRKQMEDARRSALRTDIRTTYQEYGAVDDAPIDYVFYKGFTTCLRFDVISKQYAGVKYISDHYPVKAVLCY